MKTNKDIIEEFKKKFPQLYSYCIKDGRAILGGILIKKSGEDVLAFLTKALQTKDTQIKEFIEKYGHLNLGEGEGAESLAYEWHCWKDSNIT